MSECRPLHHSDQGSTYASEDFQDLLRAHGIECSMSRRGNCLDNAVMERWFSTVTTELGETFESMGRGRVERSTTSMSSTTSAAATRLSTTRAPAR